MTSISFFKRWCWVFLLLITGVVGVMAIEEADYRIVFKEKTFEVRLYEPHIVAETVVDGEFDGAGKKSFNRLFKYITGNNTSQQKISMTSPVGQQQDASGDWAVSFMMPENYTMATLPEPKDPLVVLKQVPSSYVAAARYSGAWSEKRYLHHKELLDAWVAENKFSVDGETMWARYDAPYKPWFLRRNEVLIPIEKPSFK
jgi:hypothetical protein